jgi:hypothetical protein
MQQTANIYFLSFRRGAIQLNLHFAFILQPSTCRRCASEGRETRGLLDVSVHTAVRRGTLAMTATSISARYTGLTSRLFKTLGAVALAAGLSWVARPAIAADLYSDAPPPSYGSAYDDPRYADLYGRPPARVESYRSESYRSYEPAPPPPPIHRERYAEQCPSKHEISRMLERDGWSGFRNPQVIDRNVATIDAQRPNGRPFRLEVDRCSGAVLAERPLDRPRYGYQGDGYGPYAEYGRRPLRSF